MKLRQINEAGKGKLVIRNSGEALGTLIDFINNKGQEDHRQALTHFLENPDARLWEQTKWLIDAAAQIAKADPTMLDDIKSWGQLKKLTGPVVVSALYDIDQKYTKNTPLQKTALSKPIRDKYKLAMGPQGYIGTMSNVGELSPSRLKHILKATAKNGVATAKAAKKDVPSIRLVNRF